MKQSITAVLFDWDLTLAYGIDPALSTIERLAYLFQANGIPCTKEQIKTAVAKADHHILVKNLTGLAYPQKRRDIIRRYQIILTKLEYPDTSRHFARQLYEAYAKLPHFLYPDVTSTLTQLRAQGLRLGILSNHSQSARPMMELMLDGLINGERMVISEEEGIHKPSPRLFQIALNRMQAPPEQTAYVGDNLAVDAEGAVRSGFRVGVWLDRLNEQVDKPLQTRVRRIRSLSELPPLLASLD